MLVMSCFVCIKIVSLNYPLGRPVDLPPESEEVAGFYGVMLETEHAQDAVFNKNFFNDFLKVLEEHPPVSNDIRSLHKL